MKKLIIMLSLAIFSPVFTANAEISKVERKDGKYKKKKHRLKKLIMGKRYCECPKH